jgi:hypothetical protein
MSNEGAMIFQTETAKECQTRALECARMAEKTGSPEVAEIYRRMERRWRALALKIEAADRRHAVEDDSIRTKAGF